MSPSEHIDKRIAELNDWRGELYSGIRRLIHQADPELKENWKWGTAVWSLKTNICALSAFKNHVKINFFKGYKLTDPHGLINNGFDAKEHRAIDFFEGDALDEVKMKVLIKDAANLDRVI